ncbi:MAG: preprotein translocase subunit YajC, partial [Aeromicrobium sp.]
MSNAVDYLPLVLLVLVFWFLILRPMRKRQQQFAATQKSIAAGSRVMLASGIFGD